ncbi:unnamed protein product [Cuscuta epithymum]|uniref:HMG box domain-containing protein n=1 Tax=Cuscuta epithymum TaxID=186058 RepID=A0AAV0G226_9ASTE|nr:unnamed protein product [Cuscuta epithymum]CAH9141602.1 unnamed protein product [Cuscuta epithymum]
MKGEKSKADSRKSKSKLAVKKTSKKNVKDPNKPKRPPSAFFVFMEQFRKDYKLKHPKNKAVSVVGKAAGDKWKSMSEKEKAPYIDEAEKRKEDYDRVMKSYKEKLIEEGGDRDEPNKSKSEVNHEEEDESSGEEEEDSE